jgi:lipoic acid synthetase
VSTNLDYFRAIHPCGQDGEVMTSMERLLGQAPQMSDVRNVLAEAIKQEFGYAALRLVDEVLLGEKSQVSPQAARPNWLRAKIQASPVFDETRQIVKNLKLVTVCEEAKCPNMGECWSHRTATFMIMGEQCTRRCSFCAVKDGTLKTLSGLDPLEPLRVAQAVSKLGLKHVVITSVNRDDLPDMGAWHFHRTVSAIFRINPDCAIELLIPDMRGRQNLVAVILLSGRVKVLNHNIETVPRLYRTVRPGSSFRRSLSVLRFARELAPEVRTKSGLMVGLGESNEEILQVMDELRGVDVDVLTIGQYLQPTSKQLAIERYVTPQEFAFFREEGLKRGFLHVESAPLVRSSYHAWRHTGDGVGAKDSSPGRVIELGEESAIV